MARDIHREFKDRLYGQFARPRHQPPRFHHLVDQTVAMPLGRVKQSSGQKQVAGNLVSHLPHQHGRNDGGHKSDTHFGVAKLGLRHRQGEIAHCGESRAAGDGGPVHRGDGG